MTPWNYHNYRFISPDGSKELIYRDFFQLKTNEPFIAKAHLKYVGGMKYLGDSFCGPPLWSNDSLYIAIPRCVNDVYRGINQKLYLINTSNFEVAEYKSELRIIVLNSFDNGIIELIDSPNYSLKFHSININDLIFKSFSIADQSVYII